MRPRRQPPQHANRSSWPPERPTGAPEPECERVLASERSEDSGASMLTNQQARPRGGLARRSATPNGAKAEQGSDRKEPSQS